MLFVSRVLTVSGLKMSGPISLLSTLIQRPSFTVEPASTPGITSILPGEVVPPFAGSNRSCPGEVALAPLNLTLLSWSECNHSACKIELLFRTGNDPLLHKTEMSNLIQMIYFQRKKWYPPAPWNLMKVKWLSLGRTFTLSTLWIHWFTLSA